MTVFRECRGQAIGGLTEGCLALDPVRAGVPCHALPRCYKITVFWRNGIDETMMAIRFGAVSARIAINLLWTIGRLGVVVSKTGLWLTGESVRTH